MSNSDRLFSELESLMEEEVLIVTQAPQLNLLGQIFRPVFCGTISEVSKGTVTLSPVIIKMANAPFYEFPLPLSIPIERIASYTTDVPCDQAFPLT